MSGAKRRRVLALDPGERRTGAAGTDATGAIPLPLATLKARDVGEMARRVRELVIERAPEVILVGVPVLADGREGASARRSREIIERLRREFPQLDVVGVDEAHTTDEAHERLKSAGMRAAARKPRADSIAALVILERYLAENR